MNRCKSDIVREPFSDIMDGSHVCVKDLIHLQHLSHTSLGKYQADISLIPSRDQLALAHRRLRLDVAVGEDRVPQAALRLVPQAMAAFLHPLYVKSILWVEPPLQTTGGGGGGSTIFWKQSGLLADLNGHRDVNIGGALMKPLSGGMRTAAQAGLCAASVDTQHGSGFHIAGIEPAHLYLRACAAAAEAAGLAYVAVFIDGHKAFAKMCRPSTAKIPHADEQLRNHLHALGLAPDAIASLWEGYPAYRLQR